MPRFKVRKWLKTILAITSRDPERYPKRTAGVSFRNMNVYGYGSAADYQADVGNTPLKAVSAIKGLFGFAQKARIDILRNFEGLVKSGEMLVVLGRPGRYVILCFALLFPPAWWLHNVDVDLIAVVVPRFSKPSPVKPTDCIWTKETTSSTRAFLGTRCTSTSAVKSSIRPKPRPISRR
jgi:hypothetical protein